MTISAQCECGKSYKVRPDLAGQRVKCPACGRTFTVADPAAGLSSLDEPLDLANLEMGQPAAAAKPLPSSPAARKLASGPARGGKSSGDNSKVILIVAGIGGGVVLLLVGLLLGSFMFSSTEETVAEGTPAPAATAAPASQTSPTTPAAPAAVETPSMPTPATTPTAPETTPTAPETTPAPATPATPPTAPATTPTSAAPAAPAAEAVGWSVQADPPAQLPEWPEELSLSIPLPTGANYMVYAATPSPFIAIGLTASGGKNVQVWDLVTRKKAGELREPVDKISGAEFALSPDGQYLAAKALVSGHSSTLRLWSFQTGAVARDLPCDEPSINLQSFEFLTGDRLVTQTFGAADRKFVHRLRVWNATTGERLHDLELEDHYQKTKTAISPGGRYMAALGGRDVLFLYDLQAGKLVGKADVEKLLVHSPGPYHGMSFSPDGKQLALVFADATTKVIFLDMATATIADQFELAGKPPTASAYRGEAVEWLGTKGWCLFGGTVVDAATRKTVWNLDLPITDRLTPRRTLLGGWIAPTGPYAKHELSFLPIPWTKIDASVAVLQSDEPPHVKPGIPVSVTIRVEKLRFGSVEETATKLAEIFRDRFQADGIEVANDQPVILHVTYTESVGETLHERQGFMGPATGRTVQATKVEVQMKLVTRDSNRTLWSQDFAYDPHSVIIRDQQATDASARDAILKQLLYQLNATPIPYFVPKQTTLSPLPGLTKVGEEKKRP